MTVADTRGGICVQLAVIYAQYRLSSSTFMAVRLFQLPSLRYDGVDYINVSPKADE